MGCQQEESPYQKSARAGSLLHPKRHRRWPNRSFPLSFHRYAIYRFLFFAALVGAWYLIVAHRGSKASLRAKYQPTYFGASESSVLEAGGFQWDGDPDGDVASGGIRGSDVWRHRADWTPLGSGFEGDTSLYKSSVIKTFKTKQSPLRNCLRADASPALTPIQRLWPSEIPASLLLGGLAAGNEKEEQTVPDDVDFVPVRDFFLAPASEAGPATWHLVSPFLRSGHLYKLAKRLSSSPAPPSARALDAQFRPSLNKLLLALDGMHNGHNLCHDDIKPDNIFVASYSSSNGSGAAADTHWLLADLGNVRQIAHAYHASPLWGRTNGQLADCRSNDVVRLVKSYVKFLQLGSSHAALDGAGTPAHDFNQAFLQGTEPWSRLYWDVLAGHDAPGAGDAASEPRKATVAGRGAAATALVKSKQHVPHAAPGGGYRGYPSVPASTAGGRGRHWWPLETIVNRKLRKGMTNSETLTRWLGANGVPRTSC